MLSVQNYNTPSFCANRKRNTNDYSGTKLGAGMAALGAANVFVSKFYTNYMIKFMEKRAVAEGLSPDFKAYFQECAEIFKTAKSNIKFKPLAIAIPFYVGCGALVDFANKKQREFLGPNAKTQNGNDYTKVNMGKKLGAVLGAVTYAATLLLNKKQTSNMLKASPNKALSLAIGCGISALGGYGLGKWADKLSNKKAIKAADAQA